MSFTDKELEVLGQLPAQGISFFDFELAEHLAEEFRMNAPDCPDDQLAVLAWKFSQQMITISESIKRLTGGSMKEIESIAVVYAVVAAIFAAEAELIPEFDKPGKPDMSVFDNVPEEFRPMLNEALKQYGFGLPGAKEE